MSMKNLWKKMMGIAAALLLAFLLIPGTVEAAEQIDGRIVADFTGAMISNIRCNVRSGPSTAYAVQGSLEAGQVVNACGITDNGWFQIVYGNGSGYVSGNLLTQVPVDQNMLNALAQQAVFVKQTSGLNAAAAQQAALAAQQAAAQQQALLATQQTVVPGSGNLIFVGDSRTGMMANAVGGSAAYPGTAFLACYGGGVEWLSTAAAKKEIDAYVTPGSIIIINYGVNDLSKHGEYIKVINRYSQEWMAKGAAVYYASVGQVGENQYGKRNWAVEYFNNQLFSHLNANIGRIDLYGYLAMTGYQTEADGIHFVPETSARMFAFMKSSVGR